ncbi:hypothetical protein E2C01_059243 [Portunus trituberculatus]|uniref:Uncharacterized protein n=1 Tax=Portunus trituberculatus TaxID=210409 RepID=A0A5B7H697_PORTR|nr:hypothetical protein [Portunus trituberculatus]
MKASIGQLSAVLLPLASGSAFSGFAESRASVHPPPRLVPAVAGSRSPPGSDPSVVAAGSSGASLSVCPLPGLVPGVSGGQALSVPSPAPELAVRLFLGLFWCELQYGPTPYCGPSSECGADSHCVRCFQGVFRSRWNELACSPTSWSGSAPADPVSSVASPGVGGSSLRTAPLSGKASGVCAEPAPTGPVSSLGLVGGGETGLHATPLPGGLPGDGNFAGSASVSSMGLPHAGLLHGSMPSQVPPRPVDTGVDAGGTVVSQAAAMGWPSFSEEVDEVFEDVPSGEAGTPDEEGASSFHDLITSVRESLGLPMPSSLASTLQTGVKHTSGTSWPRPTPLVLPRSPLALEVRREQLGCSLGISNPASAKLALSRRWASRAERWYTPEGDSRGAPPLNDELLHLVESKDLSASLPWHMATQLDGILSTGNPRLTKGLRS